MTFNLRQKISTFGSAIAITAILSNATYAIEHTCSGAYEAEYKTSSSKIGKPSFWWISRENEFVRLKRYYSLGKS